MGHSRRIDVEPCGGFWAGLGQPDTAASARRGRRADPGRAGALADLNLGTDPWNTNRYAFGGGNPVSRVELDGHVNECLPCDGAIASVGAGLTLPESAPEAESDGGGLVDQAKRVGSAFVDYQSGIGAQAIDTVKGVGEFQSAQIDCFGSGDCHQQVAMVTTIVTEPSTVVRATIDPIRNDWEEGNRARATGRVAFMLGEAIAGKGVTKLGATTTRAGSAAANAAQPDIAGRFAQKSFSERFSSGGLFGGRTIDDVAGSLRLGAVPPKDVPVSVIVREGNTLILNTRSAQALTRAGIPRDSWNVIKRTGDDFFEGLLSGQLSRNGLTSYGTDLP